MKNMEESQKKETASVTGSQGNQEVKPPKKIVEISKEALEERQILAGLLLQRTERQAEESRKLRQKRYEEEFELRSGVKISLKQLDEVVTAARQPYEAMFPNSIPFFKEMYRLLGWNDKDPDSFVKPNVVGKYLKELIYARFHTDVLPALQTLAMPDGVRRAKFFQFLNEVGQEKLTQYRDEAIQLMKECKSWYEFRVKYGQRYGLPVQKALFERYQDDIAEIEGSANQA
jgi:hypothetical protein